MEISNENLAIIQKVISLHAPKYKIPGYDVEDIEQEAFIISMEYIQHWDETVGPLENFLSKHLSFRLKDFVRNNTLNNSIFKENKNRVLRPLDISVINPETENALVDQHDAIEEVEINEIVKKIDQYLPVSLRRTYLQMRAGVKVNRGRARKVKEFVEALLKEFLGEGLEDE